MAFRMSPPPIASSNVTVSGFIIDLRTPITSLLMPLSSIVGATAAMPSDVSTPRMLSTGSHTPWDQEAKDTTSYTRISARPDVVAILNLRRSP